MFNLGEEFYGGDNPRYPKKLQPSSKELQPEIAEFIKTHTKFVCVVPSFFGEEGNLVFGPDISTYAHSAPLVVKEPDLQLILEESKVCATEAKRIFTDSFNALRLPATEVLVWMLNCKDRIHQDGIPSSLPAFFALKGQSLNNEQLQAMTDIVRDELSRREIPILAECYDGLCLSFYSTCTFSLVSRVCTVVVCNEWMK